MTKLCDDEKIQTLLEAVQAERGDELSLIGELLAQFPEDPRLHFLHGSILVGTGDHLQAHKALSRAVIIAPDFVIARFQLGFFELTSGEADSALTTWQPLETLPDDHYIKLFVDGLKCLIIDNFSGAVEKLQQGQMINQENEPLNRDMQLIIDKCTDMMTDNQADESEATVSATSFVLNQYSKVSGSS